MRSYLFRFIHALVTRFPRWVVAFSLITAIGFSLYGLFFMEFITDQDRLLSEDLPYHHRYMEFIRTFGDLEFLYILVEGPSQEKMIEFADTLAVRMHRSSNLKDIIYKIDTSWAQKYALLYAEEEDLLDLREKLAANQAQIRQLYSIRSVDQILERIARSMDPKSAGRTPPSAEDTANLQTLIAALQGSYQSPFGELSGLTDKLETGQPRFEYFWSAKKDALLMMVMPSKDYTTLSVIEKPLNRIRSDIRLTEQEFPGVTAGLTGRPALQADEMKTTNKDVMNSGFLAFVAVALLFFAYFRELARPSFAILVLLFSMGWTYGFVAMTLGHLNLLSTVFCLVLIGLGIDFGIHFIARYQEELNRGLDPSAAIMETLTHIGSGTITGALTSAVAFISAMMTDFIGLAELGFVAGMGIIFCLVGMLISLPAFLVMYDRHIRHDKPIPSPFHLVGLRYVSRHPWISLGIIVLVTALLSGQLKNIRFDDNLLNLQAQDVESVVYEHKLLADSEFASWYCAFVRPTLEETRAVAERLKADPTVSKVDSLTEVLPNITPAKQDRLTEIRAFLAPALQSSPPYLPNQVLYQGLARNLEFQFLQMNQLQAQMAQQAQKPGRQGQAPPAASQEQMAQMEALKQLWDLLSGPRAAVEERLHRANRVLLEEPRQGLRKLAELAAKERVDIEQLPSVFQTLYIGDNGSFLTMAYPKEDIWQPENMARFVAAMRAIDPEVTGSPIQVFESSRLMRDSFRHIGMLSLIAVAVLVFLDFFSITSTLLVMVPLLFGVLWLLEIMGLTDVQLNLANFFAIPLLIGLGVDSSVHFYHRFMETRNVESSLHTTGSTLTVTAITTMLGFGPLIFASHRGLSSLGYLMTIGTVTCWFGSVIFLPILVKSFSRRQRPEPVPEEESDSTA